MVFAVQSYTHTAHTTACPKMVRNDGMDRYSRALNTFVSLLKPDNNAVECTCSRATVVILCSPPIGFLDVYIALHQTTSVSSVTPHQHRAALEKAAGRSPLRQLPRVPQLRGTTPPIPLPRSVRLQGQGHLEWPTRYVCRTLRNKRAHEKWA